MKFKANDIVRLVDRHKSVIVDNTTTQYNLYPNTSPHPDKVRVCMNSPFIVIKDLNEEKLFKCWYKCKSLLNGVVLEFVDHEFELDINTTRKLKIEKFYLFRKKYLMVFCISIPCERTHNIHYHHHHML